MHGSDHDQLPRSAARADAAPLRAGPRPCRHRFHRSRPGARCTWHSLHRPAVRHNVSADHRPLARERHRAAGHSAGRERWPARPAAALAGGRHGDAGRHQPLGRAQLHPLARHARAGRHGRRARALLPRHRPGRDLHLPLSGAAERHLLVSQPRRLPGPAGPERPHHHHAARSRPDPLGPRARGHAHGLDGHGPGHRDEQPEVPVRLL